MIKRDKIPNISTKNKFLKNPETRIRKQKITKNNVKSRTTPPSKRGRRRQSGSRSENEPKLAHKNPRVRFQKPPAYDVTHVGSFPGGLEGG